MHNAQKSQRLRKFAFLHDRKDFSGGWSVASQRPSRLAVSILLSRVCLTGTWNNPFLSFQQIHA